MAPPKILKDTLNVLGIRGTITSILAGLILTLVGAWAASIDKRVTSTENVNTSHAVKITTIETKVDIFLENQKRTEGKVDKLIELELENRED